MGFLRKCSLFICLLLPTVGFSQSSYTITGYGKGFKEGDKIFLLYRELGAEVSTADSTKIKDGKFEFKGTVKNVGPGSIYRNVNPVYENDVYDFVSFYVEPGNISIQSLDTLQGSILSGTPLNRDYNELRQALLTVMHEPSEKWFAVKFAFILNHPKSYVSLVTLNELSNNKKLLSQVEAIFPLLSKELKVKPLGQKILERIAFDKKISVGMMAKDFTQADVNGALIKLSDFKGKYVLVDFWASWCLPCRAENPNVLAAYQQYKEKGFTVLGVSVDDKNGKSAWLKAIKQDGLIWQQVSELNGWKNQAVILYGVTSIPANILIDPTGKIIGKDLKGKMLNDKLSEIFDLIK